MNIASPESPGAQDRSATVPNGFPKDRRVRRRGEFQKVFDSGTRIHGRFMTVLLLPNGRSRPRLGIVASKKLGGAVVRNRAKRLIREVFRQSSPRTLGLDAVVIPRRELLDASLSSLTHDFKTVWRRAAERAVNARG
jgi:ribonuclease P protein component